MNDQIKAKAILFDMDGVLVDSEAIMCEPAILALREWNVQAAPEDFDDFIGAARENLFLILPAAAMLERRPC